MRWFDTSRSRSSLFLVVAFGAIVAAQTFKSTVDYVTVPLTVQSDRHDDPAVDLRPNDFRVFDDGRLVPIVAFGKFRQSINVLLLLDTSRSMLESLSDVRSAADALIHELTPGDSIQIGSFSSALRLSPSFSVDDAHLAARVSVVPGGNMTILYDALVEGCSAFTREMERRAIFVVSDGTDTASAASARTVMQRAAEANVAIYAIGVASRQTERGRSFTRAPDSGLREIAEDTGGLYVNAGAERDFSKLFGPMMEELHQEYLLGFTPTRPDGRLHSLLVTTSQPNVKVRARKHYMAPIP